jgi:hypothetical protein
MELSYVAVVILASMVFVLSGMVGYLYWQQTRMLQHLQSLAVVISTQLVRPPEVHHEEQVEDETQVPETVKEEQEEDEVEEDDRLSVEKVEGPPTEAPVTEPVAVTAADDLESKTAAQLRDLLTQKGIPFGKRDAKAVLVQLLKATA